MPSETLSSRFGFVFLSLCLSIFLSFCSWILIVKKKIYNIFPPMYCLNTPPPSLHGLFIGQKQITTSHFAPKIQLLHQDERYSSDVLPLLLDFAPVVR